MYYLGRIVNELTFSTRVQSEYTYAVYNGPAWRKVPPGESQLVIAFHAVDAGPESNVGNASLVAAAGAPDKAGM